MTDTCPVCGKSVVCPVCGSTHAIHRGIRPEYHRCDCLEMRCGCSTLVRI